MTNNNKNILDNDQEQTQFGFTDFSERINGRLAMISFFIIVFIELWTHRPLF